MFVSPIWLALLANLTSAQGTNCTGVNAISPKCHTTETPYTRDFFYVDGRPLQSATGELTADKLYIENLSLVSGARQSKPLIFFHGGGCTATSWLNNPDNRKGFASYFIEKGYIVGLVPGFRCHSTEQIRRNQIRKSIGFVLAVLPYIAIASHHVFVAASLQYLTERLQLPLATPRLLLHYC